MTSREMAVTRYLPLRSRALELKRQARFPLLNTRVMVVWSSTRLEQPRNHGPRRAARPRDHNPLSLRLDRAIVPQGPHQAR